MFVLGLRYGLYQTYPLVQPYHIVPLFLPLSQTLLPLSIHRLDRYLLLIPLFQNRKREGQRRNTWPVGQGCCAGRMVARSAGAKDQQVRKKEVEARLNLRQIGCTVSHVDRQLVHMVEPIPVRVISP